MRTDSTVPAIRHIGTWSLLVLGLAPCGVASGQFDQLDIVIEESGPLAEPDFLVRVVARGLAFLEAPAVTPPSGEPLDLVTNDPFFSSGTWEGVFDSLGEALEFVSGDWEATYSQRSLESGQPERITRDIEVSPIRESDVVRSAPTLLSPVANGSLPDGVESLFEWEYEVSPADLSLISIFAPELGLGGTSVRSTPTLSSSSSGSGFSSTGESELRIAYRDDPEADTNRWIYEIDASDADLPTDLTLQLGGYTPLNSFLSVDGEPAAAFFGRQQISYVRLADPVTVQLIVPEPSTLGLLILAGFTKSSRRSRHA